jgi:hypothetical protein
MLRTWMGIGLFFGTAAAVVIAVGACGTDAIGIDTCRQVEEARCRQAPHCSGIDLSQPVHRNSPITDVDACIRYYHDACLHGLAASADPGAVATKACVDAINTGDCAIVITPQVAPACAWLVPPASVDAAADVDAADAADAADTATE